MKPSHPAKPTAPTNYAPSVPMSVYRELAAELRANKAVIDSLNSRNHQLAEQNQFLKQEIHNVVQATLNLGQAAGVARQAAQEMGAQNFPSALTSSFPGKIAPDTLAKLVKAEVDAQTKASEAIRQAHAYDPAHDQQAPVAHTPQVAATQPIAKAIPRAPQSPSAAPPTPRNRVPRPIAPAENPAAQAAANASAAKAVAKKQAAAQPKGSASKHSRKPASKAVSKPAGKPAHPAAYRPTETIPGKGTLVQRPAGKPAPAQGKLFTEQSGEYRSSALDAEENKEIGGIWLALSIILIIVTAFGAGFLIMKPLLNDR